MPIEISFGILASRFRVLLGVISLKLETSINIVKCLVCLHNFLMKSEITEDENKKSYANVKLVDQLFKEIQSKENDIEKEEEEEEQEQEEEIFVEKIINKNNIRNTLAKYLKDN